MFGREPALWLPVERIDRELSAELLSESNIF